MWVGANVRIERHTAPSPEIGDEPVVGTGIGAVRSDKHVRHELVLLYSLHAPTYLGEPELALRVWINRLISSRTVGGAVTTGVCPMPVARTGPRNSKS